MSKNNHSARAFYILVLFCPLPSSAKQQCEMTTFKVLWRTLTDDGEFFIFFLNLYATPTNLVPGLFAIIVKVERVEIIAK